MTKDEVFRVWAPQGGAWSRWVKPVLFAHVGMGGGPDAAPIGERAIADYALRLTQVVPRDLAVATYRTSARPENVAIVVELPGASAVHAAVALARLGFRPVPLFNAYPALGMSAAVDVWSIVVALERDAALLAPLPLHDHAPPAFVLDASRRGRASGDTARFDNRSICTLSDFPTTGDLTARGIEHVVVLREATTTAFARDLEGVLLRYQDEGLKIHAASMAESTEPTAVRVSRPPLFARIGETFYRWSLWPTDEGGFGRAHTS